MKILYFTAPWCMPCKVFGPIMDETIPNYDIEYEKVDIDKNPESVANFDLMGVPTVVMQRDGKEVGRFSGARNSNELGAWISAAI